jgi:hypothetical protein
LTIDWRTIGDVDIGIWRRTLHDARSPLEFVAAEAYESASPHTALALAMLNQESSYATRFRLNTPSNHNPLNLRPPNGNGYLRFASWVDGVRAWRDRITDADYKAGIYAQTTTVSDLVHVYAPSSDNNDESAYVAGIAASLLRWGVSPKEIQPLSTPQIYDLSRDYARFGLSLDEAREVLSHRFDNRNFVKPEFIVLHIQAGTSRSSLDWWANGPGVQASSTVMAQHDGSILNIIPEQHAPWTNGDDNQPSANGQRLVSLPGNSNLYTLSIEAEGVDGSDTTAAQLDSVVWQVETWMADYGIPKANILRHADINSVDRPNCPGAYYAKVMARIGETPAPTVPKAAPIWWTPGDVGIQTRPADGFKSLALLGEVTAKKPVTIRTTANAKAPAIVTLKQGEKRRIAGTMRAPDNAGTRWVFIETSPGSDEWGRARHSSFEERFPTP